MATITRADGWVIQSCATTLQCAVMLSPDGSNARRRTIEVFISSPKRDMAAAAMDSVWALNRQTAPQLKQIYEGYGE